MLNNLDQRNENPRPFAWTAGTELIVGEVERFCRRIPRSGREVTMVTQAPTIPVKMRPDPLDIQFQPVADMVSHRSVCRFRVIPRDGLDEFRVKAIWQVSSVGRCVIEPIEDEDLILFNCFPQGHTPCALGNPHV